MKVLPPIVAVLFLVSMQPAAASPDGNAMLPACRLAAAEVVPADSREGLQIGLCLGMIEGVQGMNAMLQSVQGSKMGFCTPDGVTNTQRARIFVRYLEDNPDKLHNPASLLVVVALIHAFPCT